jgi:plasmid maintenance system antidote protein VapI
MQQAKTVRRPYPSNRRPRPGTRRRKGPPTVGQVLAAAMKANGLSARAVALACNCAVSELNELFQGCLLTSAMSRKLASGFRTDPDHWSSIDRADRESRYPVR